MDAYVCRLCGARHWRYEPHVWGNDAPASPKAAKAKAPKPAPVAAPSDRAVQAAPIVTYADRFEEIERRLASLEAAVAKLALSIQPKPTGEKADRTAYHRDYKRKQRAMERGGADEHAEA